MNKIVLVGRIVRDVELKQVGNNGRVVNNVIAVSRYHKDSSGERQADFIPFVAWNHHADLLNKYAKKGDQISISGRLQSRKYKNKDEQEVFVIECFVDDVTFIFQGQSNVSPPKNEDKSVEETAKVIA